MAPQSVGLIMGPMFLVTSVPGTALAAWLGARCRPGEALQHLMKVMIGLIAILLPLVISVSLAPTSIALPLVALTLLTYAACHCALLVPIQLITPNRMRGRIAAVTTLIYVIPAGLGPVAIGYLTDHVFKDPMALGKAMAIVMGTSSACALLAGVFAWSVARRIERAKATASTTPVVTRFEGSLQSV
jgi:MFS family permease